MTAHELAAILLKGPNLEVTMEVHFSTGGYSLCIVTDVAHKVTKYDGDCIKLSSDETEFGE